MYTLIDTKKNKELATLNSKQELIDKVNLIANDDKFRIAPINTIEDCFEYINQYTLDYDLVKDSEVNSFIETYGIEVDENESDHYVELMMDDHKCIKWKGKEYYIGENLNLDEVEDSVYMIIAYSLHV
jgi:hypothetical protein